MARDVNPVTAHRRAEKAKQIKKSKEQITERRTERLAGRNPQRIEKAIEELKLIEQGGRLTAVERERLARLEKELTDVERAKRKRPDLRPEPSGDRRRDGDEPRGEKRRRGNEDESDGGSTDPETRRIPMPRDTPPPIPPEVMVKLKESRKALWEEEQRRRQEQGPHALPMKPASVAKPVEVKSSYSAEPVLRDLKKEAIKAFVPNVIRRGQPAKGNGTNHRLKEPEEAERREAEASARSIIVTKNPRTATVEEDDEMDDAALMMLVEEEEAYTHDAITNESVETLASQPQNQTPGNNQTSDLKEPKDPPEPSTLPAQRPAPKEPWLDSAREKLGHGLVAYNGGESDDEW